MSDMQYEPEPGQLTAKSLAKGMLAGVAGGLVATVAKNMVERIYPPQANAEPAFSSVSERVVEHVSGDILPPDSEPVAAETLHWAFGALVGAAYGGLAEFYPAATAKDGASFGIALGSLMHEGALPALGLSAPQEDQTLRERASEFSSHMVFGVVAENVRRVVRKLLR